jgi:16S rRNA processing protein RimM
VYVRADDRPQLPDGEYYHHQLIGLQVVSDEGDILGILTGIIETGANDVYIVRSENDREVLLPAIESVILEIDLERSEMLVRVIPGLIPEG